MYKYEVRFKYNTDSNGGCTSKTVQITFPKRVYAFTDVYGNDGKGRNEILTKAVNELGLDPSRVEALADRNKLDGGWYKLTYLGEANQNSNSNNASTNISQEDRDANRISAIEADRERRAERAEERERKAIRDERQRLIDIEEAKVRAEKEARERAERKQRANELRSQGKNFQAFLVEFQNGVIMVSLVAGIGLFLLFSSHNKESNMEDAMKINSELELIEDSVKIYISNKNYDKALVLANKLVHNSHEDMENLEFDSWNGYPKFDEYWTKKREEYKKIIFNKGSLNSEKPAVEKPQAEKTESEVNQDAPVEEDKFKYNDSINNQEGLDDEYKN